MDNTNSSTQTGKYDGLLEAINDYNAAFGEHFDSNNVRGYTEAVVTRLNKTVDDKRYFDLDFVVELLSTGFNAPESNCSYVDRTRLGANLNSAYSRKYRVQNLLNKPFGRIVKVRWHKLTEKLMKEELLVYAHRDSDNVQHSVGPDDTSGVIEKS